MMSGDVPATDIAADTVSGGGDVIVCRACRQRITDTGEQCMAQGARDHTFCNPAGILYQVSCFRAAPGVGYRGSPTAEWSWFTGYRWRMAHCRGCGQHLGWLFQGRGGDVFHALIMQRLSPLDCG